MAADGIRKKEAVLETSGVDVESSKRVQQELIVNEIEDKMVHSMKEVEIGKDLTFNTEVGCPPKLHSSGNAWKPLCRIDQTIGEKEKLKRNVQAVLNKLTFQKFKILLSQLKRLNIETEEELELVVNLIYENAINEPHFCVLYANLCKHLALKMPFDNASTTKGFCKLLLSKCNTGFEEKYQVLDADSSEKLLPQDMLENKRIKSRRIGNIRFISELFKFKMIPMSTVFEWIDYLLADGREASLEFFFWFMKTAGKELESQEKDAVDDYFNRIQKIIEYRCTSSRMRFLLQDIVELKENNWIPRRLENLPRTIDEIHREAALELRRQSMPFVGVCQVF